MKNGFSSDIPCLESCSFLDIKMSEVQLSTTKFKNENVSRLTLAFPERISRTETYHAFTFQDFVSEIGGYVGLFLGFSIYNIANIFDAMFMKSKGHEISSDCVKCSSCFVKICK